MTHPLEEALRGLQPDAPQLDWRQLWLEQGRAEGRAERLATRWWSHPAWAGLGLVSTAASLLLTVLLLSPRPPRADSGGMAQRNPVDPPSSAVATEKNSEAESPHAGQPHLEDTVPSTQTPPPIYTAAWLPAWPRLELRPEWQRRQQLLRRGDAGLDAYLSCEQSAGLLAPRDSAGNPESTWNELIPLPSQPEIEPTGKTLILGDWL